MILARVRSRVVSHTQSPRLPKRALLTVYPEEGYGVVTHPIIAIDSVQAGPGDLVLVMQEGTGARQAVLDDPSLPLPAQAVVIGVVDEVQL